MIMVAIGRKVGAQLFVYFDEEQSSGSLSLIAMSWHIAGPLAACLLPCSLESKHSKLTFATTNITKPFDNPPNAPLRILRPCDSYP